MGCLMSKKSQQLANNQQWTTTDKTYSWSNRDRSHLMNYLIENESNSIQIRLPGEIGGEQFIIQNCNDSTICLYDYSNTVTIDDCRNCTFFIGPVIGSIVIRNCQDCRLMSASQQFRTRDCKRLDLYIFCATQPAIESCHNLVFSCFTANYKGLQEQFEKTNLQIYNNKWFNVYDFSIDNRDKHWTIDSSNNKLNESFCSIPLDNNQLNLSFNPLTSLVPITEGLTSLDSISDDDESFNMIIIYSHSTLTMHNRIESQVGKIVREIHFNFKELVLLMTRYLDSELSIKNILTRMLNGKEEEMMLNNDKGNKSRLTPNQSIIMLYRGKFNAERLNEICRRIFCPQMHHGGHAEIKFKMIERNQNEFIFNECLTLTFDNCF
ncbi:Protein Xrp2 [Dermatophagoides farinae]|uniref:Protein Xrp2 n=1 Tax=Dermatophagoides farinae TaxID=6954 RepID=A0A922L313_DERFA|nr:Protein Xrp2 [Dermatophagoides farinae]